MKALLTLLATIASIPVFVVLGAAAWVGDRAYDTGWYFGGLLDQMEEWAEL
jgi:hypothetical protein